MRYAGTVRGEFSIDDHIMRKALSHVPITRRTKRCPAAYSLSPVVGFPSRAMTGRSHHVIITTECDAQELFEGVLLRPQRVKHCWVAQNAPVPRGPGPIQRQSSKGIVGLAPRMEGGQGLPVATGIEPTRVKIAQGGIVTDGVARRSVRRAEDVQMLTA